MKAHPSCERRSGARNSSEYRIASPSAQYFQLVSIYEASFCFLPKNNTMLAGRIRQHGFAKLLSSYWLTTTAGVPRATRLLFSTTPAERMLPM